MNWFNRLASFFALSRPPEPSSRYIFVRGTQSGVRVDHDTALTYSAVWACVRVIADTTATLSWHVMQRRADGGKERLASHPVDWLLDVQPNPEMTAFTFRQLMLAWTLTWGNGYAEIERDGARRPIWLWPISPDRVTPMRATAELVEDEGLDVPVNSIVYRVWNQTAPPSFVPVADMFHIKGLGFDGLVGYSVVNMMARSISLGIAMEESGSSLFGNGSRPDGILKYDGKVTAEVQTQTREEWEKVHRGPKNRSRLAVLGGNATYQPITMPNDDAQWLEARKFQATEVARWYRVPPHKIGDLTHATFSNIEEQSIEFVTDTIVPWAVPLEQEANIKLFGRASQGRLITKLNVNALMRGDSARRAEYFNKMGDIYSINEKRAYEDLNPIGPDGDKRLVQLNLTTLEKVGEEPPPAPPTEPDETDDDDAPSRMRALSNGHKGDGE